MQSAQYAAPQSVSEAVEILAADTDARVLAGGTDLLIQTRGGVVSPSTFVDIKRIPDLLRLTIDADGARIGAAVPAAEIYENAEFKSIWPGVAEATDLIGSTQIQGRATLSGNLCNGSPAADTVPALIVNNASAVVIGPDGERTVAVEEFVTGPGQTVLGRGELLVEFRIPRPAAHSSDAYLRLIPRTEMDIAVAGAAVALTLDGDTCTAARVAIGAVGPRAIPVPAAGEALVGSTLDDAALAAAADASTAAATPIDDKRGTIAYRKTVVGVLTKRAAAIAAERAKGRS